VLATALPVDATSIATTTKPLPSACLLTRHPL